MTPCSCSLSRRSAGIGFSVVLAVGGDGRAVVDESVGRGGQAARRRERSGAEPVRPRRGIRTVAVRCAAPLRGQRELGAPRSPAGARPPSAPSSAAGNRTASHRSTPGRRSPSRTRRTSRCRPTARRFPASRPAARTSSAIRTPDRTPSTNGWIGRPSSGSIRRPRPGSSATRPRTSCAAPATPASTCRWCEASPLWRRHGCSSAPNRSTSRTT